MNESIRLWWRARSTREQRLLLVMGALAACVLIWLLIVRPLADTLDRARTRHAAAVLALAEARGRTFASAAAPVTVPQPVDAFIGTSLAEAGLQGAQTLGQGPAAARVTVPAARPQALFTWIAAMEARGLAVETLRSTANPDRTVAAEVVLRARGG